MSSQQLLPHDIDAEENVVGSLLIDGSAIFKVAGLLAKDDFYSEPNQLVYEACLSLYQRNNQAIDQITVAQELAQQGKLETCGGAAYLSHLVSNVVTSLHIEEYAQIVYRLSVMRRLISAGNQITAIGYDSEPDVDASLNKAEDILFRLRHGQSPRDFIHIRQVLDDYLETTVSSADTDEDRGKRVHLYSGFPALDETLDEMQRSDLIIIAGRPSMGKTSLALSIARNVAVDRGACVAMFSLEMAREPLVLRLLANESGVNPRRIRLGSHTEEEEKRIMDATGILSEAPIYIDDSPHLRVVEMRSKARRLHFERGVDMIIVDHLGLMQADGRGENRVQEISYISRSLKALARELNIPLIAVSQLSRASEWRASHKPQLSDLRDSGSIEQDADVVLFIYRDEYYYSTKEEWQSQHPGESYPPPAEVIIAKHRNGPVGQVNLRFLPGIAKFDNITTEEPSFL